MILELLHNCLVWSHIYGNFGNKYLFLLLLWLHRRLRSLDFVKRLLNLNLLTNFKVIFHQCWSVGLEFVSKIFLISSRIFRTCWRCWPISFWLATFRSNQNRSFLFEFLIKSLLVSLNLQSLLHLRLGMLSICVFWFGLQHRLGLWVRYRVISLGYFHRIGEIAPNRQIKVSYFTTQPYRFILDTLFNFQGTWHRINKWRFLLLFEINLS